MKTTKIGIPQIKVLSHKLNSPAVIKLLFCLHALPHSKYSPKIYILGMLIKIQNGWISKLADYLLKVISEK